MANRSTLSRVLHRRTAEERTAAASKKTAIESRISKVATGDHTDRVSPPSMRRFWPVMYPPWSDASQEIKDETSSVRP